MTLHLTGPALRFFATSRSLQPARQVNAVVRGLGLSGTLSTWISPMLVTVSTASYRTWIDEYLDDPKKRRLAIEAVDAFERGENAESISADEIAPVVDAASCDFVRVWEIGVDLLNRLAARHQEARNAIVKMLGDRKAGVRFQAVAMLGLSAFPRPFAVSLIQLGLRDRSYQVRGKVAEAACQLNLTELVGELEALQTAEKHAVARQSMEFAVALLREGYLLQSTGGKLSNIWVKREVNRGWCISVPITDDDLRAGRLESIIAKAKAMP